MLVLMKDGGTAGVDGNVYAIVNSTCQWEVRENVFMSYKATFLSL